MPLATSEKADHTIRQAEAVARMSKGRNRDVERDFQRIADDMIRRTERIHCTLEQRQQGLGIIINALQIMLDIVTEERLRS